MLPIVALIAIGVIVLFIVFAMRKRNKGQDLGDPKAGR
jgi:heme/copper-type cytochrome/quinol oxidase subunit 2